MNHLTTGKLLAALGGIAVIGGIVLLASGVFNPAFTDGGVDVRNTKCEQLGSARAAIATELEQRKLDAQNRLDADKDKASDDYWAQNRQLEDAYHQCISAALTADPCKEPFEEVGRLYEEIMADFEAGKGFNEAKFNEREAAKRRYNDCVEQTRKPEFYPEKEAACKAALDAGRATNQQNREAAEAAAQTRYESAVAQAESAFQQKAAILDAIEKECNEPGGTSNVNIGTLTTGGTGTEIKTSSSACTGVFAGNDPAIEKQIRDLESQLQKAQAGGQSGGLFGTEHIQEALDRLRQELRDAERTCKVDADCGNPEPVCCSGTQVGRAYCADGVCASEKIDCVSPEICAGKPAQCVAPDTGLQQQNGVYISHTIPEQGSCSNNLQVLNLQQSTPDSARYSIVGNIPGWLHIDKPGGPLPGNVNVTYSCGTVQGYGPGTYTAAGSITVFNAANELINTIPLTVSITVTPVQKMVDVIEYNGKLIPLDQVHKFTGPECDEEEHWHANNVGALALDGSRVPDGGECGYGKTKDVAVRTVPDTRKARGEVRGLEGLKTR